MGLGLEARAPLTRRKLIGSATIATLEQIAEAIRNGADDTPLEAGASVTENEPDADYTIYLHPAAEPVFLTRDRNFAVVDAKTSDVGPGYHALLVSILDSLEKSLGLKWEWEDETDYARNRDFDLLQVKMADLFKALAKRVAELCDKVGSTGMRLSVPMDFGLSSYGDKVMSHVGPIAAEDLRHWGTLGGADLARAAADFFPWWGKAFDGGFYRGIALHALWMEQRWATPLDRDEIADTKRTLHWCEEAVRLGAALPMSDAAIQEIKNLLAQTGPHSFAAESGIGYRRCWLEKRLPGGWRLTVPGSMAAGWEDVPEDEPETAVFWTKDFQVRALVVGIGFPSPMTEDAEVGDIIVSRELEEVRPGEWSLTVKSTRLTEDHTDEVCYLMFLMRGQGMLEIADKIAATLKYEAPRKRSVDVTDYEES
jgi:hypothetical protein